MPCRYTRDEILHMALDEAQVANLDQHDRPNGVIQQNALCIGWLQQVLDQIHNVIPASATVVKKEIVCKAQEEIVVLPEDFIVDMRNGLLVQTIPGNRQSFKRAERVPLQKMLNRMVSHQGASNVNYPTWYCVAGDDGNPITQLQTMYIAPIPSIDAQAVLWYYQKPQPLQANQKPKLPGEEPLIRYVRIRALEWIGVAELGTSDKAAQIAVSQYKASGLFNEPEEDEIPMDSAVYRRGDLYSINNTYAWLGRQ